ncbi:MAG: hypothetical protein AB2A00_00750 [Myxococcota bacterium]
MSTHRLLLLTALAVTVVGCKDCKRGESPAPASAPAQAEPPIPIPADVSPEERAMLKDALSGPDEPVQPVYPLDAGPPSALAERLCRALHEIPFQRRQECCKAGGKMLPLWKECVRMLTFALNSKALTLDEKSVDGCEAALQREHAGCDWVGNPRSLIPDECQGILLGRLATGAECRSTLECVAPNVCAGVGPTERGRCAPPGPTGSPCGTSVDPLMVYAKQTTLETERPACADGYCNRNRCVPPVAAGGECNTSLQCAKGHRCVARKCVAGGVAKLGEPCGDNRCEGEARCVGGFCAMLKGPGERCTESAECKGACLHDDAGVGTCGMQCKPAAFTPLRTPLPKLKQPAKP